MCTNALHRRGVRLPEPGGSSWSLAGAVAPVGGRDVTAGACALLDESEQLSVHPRGLSSTR